MQIELDDKMIVGLLKMWAKRNLANEGLEIDTFEWKQGKLIIKLKEETIDNDQEQ